MKRYILQIQASISADGWNGSVGLPTLILEAASVEEAHRKVADIMEHLPVGSTYALAEDGYHLCCYAPVDMGHSFGCPHSPENLEGETS